MTSQVTQGPTGSSRPVAAPVALVTEYLAPVTGRSVAAQVGTALAVVTGLWVAISPWFLTLQAGGHNATANNLIVGLAVAALGVFGVSGIRGFLGTEVGSLLLGIWLIISPFILAATYTIQASMYWSNIWAGAIIAILSMASMAMLRRARTE